MEAKKSYKHCLISVIIGIICICCFIEISAQDPGFNYLVLAGEAEENGEFKKAIEYYLLAANYYIEEENKSYAAWSYFEAGEVCILLKDFENAFTYFEYSGQLFEEDERPVDVSFVNLFAGYAKFKLKQYDEAAGTFIYAGETAESQKVYGNAGYAYDGAGHAIKYSDWENARYYWNLAKENFNKQGLLDYTIPSDLEIEIEIPSNSIILVGEFYSEIDSFKQGEAVNISGQVLYEGKPIAPNDQTIRIELIASEFYEVSNPSTRKAILKTDEEGYFSMMPFAGWNIGYYTFISEAFYTEDDKDFTASDTIYVKIAESTGTTNFESQLERIKEHYVKAISKGPIWTDNTALEYVANKLKIYTPKEGTLKAGWVHNLILANRSDGKWDVDADFTCQGYQRSVMQFLNSIRFNAEPEVRKLMEGIDYGPIERGNSGYFSNWTYHVGVVLYQIGKDWKNDPEAVVFDPWFTQTPKVYDMNSWKKIGTFSYSAIYPWVVNVDYDAIQDAGKNIWSGFPIAGSDICSNVISQSDFFNARHHVIPKYKFYVDCPVSILITDTEGKETGVIANGSFLQEFPAYIHCLEDEESDYDLSWFVELPEGSYTVNIKGLDEGEFNVVLVNDTLQSEPFFYATQPIRKGETATITLGSDIDKPILILPDGTEVESGSASVGIHEGYATTYDNVLTQNHPNPFSEKTLISFYLTRNTDVKLEIYDISGKCIKALLNAFKSAGEHAVSWNGTDESGATVQSGMYLYKITTNNFAITKKMFLIR